MSGRTVKALRRGGAQGLGRAPTRRELRAIKRAYKRRHRG